MAPDLIAVIYCLGELPHEAALARLLELKTSESYLVAGNAANAIELRGPRLTRATPLA